MGRNRFVTSEVRRLELSDGDWIEVKRRLSYGEQQRYTTAGLGKVQSTASAGDAGDGADASFEINWAAIGVERVLVWLVDWSFRDERDKAVRITRDSIRALDPETFKEIDDALTLHIAAEEAEKNA